MFEGSIPSLAEANSNGEKLERTFGKHSKKILIEVPISTSRYRSMQHPARWPLSRVRPVNRQLREDPNVKKLRVKLRTVAVGMVRTARACTAQKVIKSNCSPVEVHFFFFLKTKRVRACTRTCETNSLSLCRFAAHVDLRAHSDGRSGCFRPVHMHDREKNIKNLREYLLLEKEHSLTLIAHSFEP